MIIRIEAANLPGIRCQPSPGVGPLENIHVGIGNRGEASELFRGDAASASWRVEVRTADAGEPVEAFLYASPPGGGYALVFSHNGLGIEHVLVDPVTWRVTGVIDWGDAALKGQPPTSGGSNRSGR